MGVGVTQCVRMMYMSCVHVLLFKPFHYIVRKITLIYIYFDKEKAFKNSYTLN